MELIILRIKEGEKIMDGDASLWGIWKERNWVIFEDAKCLVSRIQSSFTSSLIFWVGSIDVGGALLYNTYCAFCNSTFGW